MDRNDIITLLEHLQKNIIIEDNIFTLKLFHILQQTEEQNRLIEAIKSIHDRIWRLITLINRIEIVSHFNNNNSSLFFQRDSISYDVHIFHNELRRIFDDIAHIINLSSDKSYSIPQSFYQLLNFVDALHFCDELKEELIKCNYFSEIKSIRDNYIHSSLRLHVCNFGPGHFDIVISDDRINPVIQDYPYIFNSGNNTFSLKDYIVLRFSQIFKLINAVSKQILDFNTCKLHEAFLELDGIKVLSVWSDSFYKRLLSGYTKNC